MGGFFLHLRNAGEEAQLSESVYQKSLDVFDKKGLSLDRKIVGDRFVVYAFRKLLISQSHVVEFENGDFALSSGTLLYNNKTGVPALSELYAMFNHDLAAVERAIDGQFCVVLYKNRQLSIFTDYCRYYPVYSNASRTVFSNSFLSVARTVSPKVSAHELYQYVLHGFFVGEGTLLQDVKIVNNRKIHNIIPEVRQIERKPAHNAIPVEFTYKETLEHIVKELSDHFAMFGRAFGNTIGTALSGGYDSRLQLALLRRTGSTPVVHVYGASDSADVVVAKACAAGEGFALDHVDKSATPRFSAEQMAESVKHSLFFFDGIKPAGLFDNGAERQTRTMRAKKAPLQLNASGGEIYREIWNIADRNVDLINFIRQRYDRGLYDFLPKSFDSRNYWAEFAEKVGQTNNIDRPWISRNEAEMLFPFMRNWFGAPNNAANNQLTYALEPFMQARFIFPSISLPLHFKYAGRLEADLIKAIDPSLAKYNSQYGINFFDPIPLNFRLKKAAKRLVPLPVRLVKRNFQLRLKPLVLPYYLQTAYVKHLVDPGNLRISEFVDVAKIDHGETLSRAFSVELLLNTI